MHHLLTALLLLNTTAGGSAAKVGLAKNAKVVHADGSSAQLKRAMELLEADTVEVGQEGLVVLELPNHYLVRVDEDLSLKVSDIVLRNKPETRQTAEEQLKRLLSEDESKTNETELLAGAGNSVAPAAAPASPES